MSIRPLFLALIGIMASTVAAQGPVPAGPQTPPAGTALIIGRVVDGSTGGPVTGVAVTIGGSSAPRTGNVVLVDSQGRFIFNGLAAGSFTVRAQKNGYLSGAYGATQPGGRSQEIVLRDGQRVTDALIKVWRHGSIDGRVVDEAGEPVSGAFLYALRRTWVGGRPSLSTNYSAVSDDRGVYHIGRLPPGEYIVGMMSRLITYPIGFVEADVASRQAGDASQQTRSAELAAKGSNIMGIVPAYPSPRIGDFTIARADGPTTPLPTDNGRLAVFPITFYPSAPTTVLATPIFLSAGERRASVDLHLRLTPTMKVSGTATGPGGPISNLGLRLQLGAGSEFQSRRLFEPAQTVTDANGAFAFLGVPPGSYNIVAAMSPQQGEGLSADLPVTVGNKDLADIALTLHPNRRVSGRVEFDGTSEKPDARILSLLIGLDPVDGHFERQTFQVEASGAFPGLAVLPGRYFVHVGVNEGEAYRLGTWTLKSALVGGRDVSDVPLTVDASDITDLVITLTDHPTTLAGTVRTTQGAADATATVLVFPVDRAMWTDYGGLPRRLRSVRPDRTGGYSVPALPAGEYFVIAVPDELTGDWQRQTALEKASAMATRVRIEDRNNAAIDLVTKRW